MLILVVLVIVIAIRVGSEDIDHEHDYDGPSQGREKTRCYAAGAAVAGATRDLFKRAFRRFAAFL